MRLSRRNPKGKAHKIRWTRLVPVLTLLLLLIGGGVYYVSPISAPVSSSMPPAPSATLETAAYESTEDLLPPEADPARAGGLAEEGAAQGAAAEDEQDSGVYRGEISNGDTLGSILQAWLTPAEINTLAQACKSIYSVNRIRQGQPYAVFSEGGSMVRFEYEIDNDSRLVISKEGETFTACQEEIEYDIQLHRVEGTIASSLFNAMIDSGERAQLAVNLADVFAWEINFIRDLRTDDNFTLLVEKRYRDGDFKGYGKLLAATFTNQNTVYEAYLFTDADGHSQYYNASGESLRRAFLKAPLSFTRISSGYTNRRLHPVLMDWRAHSAIDYAAPTGTPVKSVGKGEVTFKGYSKSAGNYIKVKHLNNYETMYLHLSAFAKGLQKGNKVSQGQVIGFVGSTGYATGPHLDFRMKKNGNYVNPLKELAPRDNPVSKQEMPRFTAQQQVYRDFLDNRRNLAEYSRSLISEL